jgi:hypothetical protein
MVISPRESVTVRLVFSLSFEPKSVPRSVPTKMVAMLKIVPKPIIAQV